MQTRLKKKLPFVILRVLLITFVVGNFVAWFAGAKPVEFPKWPYSAADQQTLSELKGAHGSDTIDPYYALSAGMIYFLHNDLDAADAVVAAVDSQQPANLSLRALQAAIAVKQAGVMLDLAFGQVKLYKLKRALEELQACATTAPDQFDVQLLALWSFASLPNIADGDRRGMVIAERLEQQISRADNTIPSDMVGSAWLAISRLYVFMALQQGANQSMWKLRAKNAWDQFQRLNINASWMAKDKQDIAASYARIE